MLYEEIDDPGSMTADELRARYEAELAETIVTVGADEVIAETDVDEGTVSALVEGESPELSLEDAAAIYSTGDDRPPKDDVLLEVRDHLLMGMTTAVLDVDTLASEIDRDMGPRTIQQKIEGRAPMTLGEYALVHHAIAARNDG